MLTYPKDEVFHIRQAQAYVQGKWQIWDPKITTPPGLYLVSWVQIWLARYMGYVGLDVRWYRSVNQIAIVVLAWVLQQLIGYIFGFEACRPKPATSGDDGPKPKWSLRQLTHTVVNILLFPPLFFFYGLYYTDVFSVLSVLLTYYFHAQSQQALMALCGVASLLFRQTNVFWVGIYLAGLQLQRAIPRGNINVQFPAALTISTILRNSWQHACVFDFLIKDAWLEGMATWQRPHH